MQFALCFLGRDLTFFFIPMYRSHLSNKVYELFEISTQAILAIRILTTP